MREEFEVQTILYGMMQDGCSKEEAIAYILMMDCYSPEVIAKVIKNANR